MIEIQMDRDRERERGTEWQRKWKLLVCFNAQENKFQTKDNNQPTNQRTNQKKIVREKGESAVFDVDMCE